MQSFLPKKNNFIKPTQSHIAKFQKKNKQIQTNLNPFQVALQKAGIQAKLRIAQAHDSYEQEAGQVAEQVVSIPEPNIVQKKCATCAAQEHLRGRLIQSKLDQKFQQKPRIQNKINSTTNSPQVQKEALEKDKDIINNIENVNDNLGAKKITIVDTGLREWPLKKVGTIKLKLKVSFVRGKTPLDVKRKEGDLSHGIKVTSSEWNPIMDKYALKVGSASQDFLNLGCGLKVGIGFDAVKADQTGKIRFGTVKINGKASFGKKELEAGSKCDLLNFLQGKNRRFLKDIANGWKLEISLQGSLEMDHAELARLLALKKLNKEIDELHQESQKVKERLEREKHNEARAEKKFKAKEKRELQKNQKKGKRYKKKKWRDSKDYRRFQTQKSKYKQKAKEIANKLNSKAEKIKDVGSKMKSTWGRKLAKKMVGSVLKRLNIASAALSAALMGAKAIKHWDNLDFKLPWDSGISIDDALLFEDIPAGGTRANDPSELKNLPAAGEKSTKRGRGPSDNDNQGQGLEEKKKKISNDSAKSSKAKGTDIESALEKISEKPVRDLIDFTLTLKGKEEGLKVDKAILGKLLQVIPKDLTESERQSIENFMRVAPTDQSSQAYIDNIQKHIKLLRYPKAHNRKEETWIFQKKGITMHIHPSEGAKDLNDYLKDSKPGLQKFKIPMDISIDPAKFSALKGKGFGKEKNHFRLENPLFEVEKIDTTKNGKFDKVHFKLLNTVTRLKGKESIFDISNFPKHFRPLTIYIFGKKTVDK